MKTRSHCSSRSSLIWVCNVCLDLSVQKLRIITVDSLLILKLCIHIFCVLERCRSDEFQCRSDRSCINRDDYCNGVRDCSDGSDEVGCRKYISSVDPTELSSSEMIIVTVYEIVLTALMKLAAVSIFPV